MKHKAQFGWIGRAQKTVKTECGKRVACVHIAIDCDSDCPECRKAVDNSIAALLAVAESFVKHHGPHSVVDSARKAATDPRCYQTIYFL